MLNVCFFGFCELLEFRKGIGGGTMQAESFPCQFLLFVAVSNGSSANLGKLKANHAYNDDCGFSFHGLHHCLTVSASSYGIAQHYFVARTLSNYDKIRNLYDATGIMCRA